MWLAVAAVAWLAVGCAFAWYKRDADRSAWYHVGVALSHPFWLLAGLASVAATLVATAVYLALNMDRRDK